MKTEKSMRFGSRDLNDNVNLAADKKKLQGDGRVLYSGNNIVVGFIVIMLRWRMVWLNVYLIRVE